MNRFVLIFLSDLLAITIVLNIGTIVNSIFAGSIIFFRNIFKTSEFGYYANLAHTGG